MYRLMLWAVALSTLVLVPHIEAVAQQARTETRNTSYDDVRRKIRIQQASPEALRKLGYEISPGIIISPSAAVEGGYDSNPDQLFVEEGTSYLRSDADVTLGIVRPGAATTFTLQGAAVNFNELDESERWSAGASFDTYFELAPGTNLTGGAFVLQDDISANQTRTAGGYSQLLYRNEELEAFAALRMHQVEHLDTSIIGPGTPGVLVPFLRNGEFDFRRVEGSGGMLYGHNRMLAVYIRSGYALVDYTDQQIEALIDRDAMDFFIVSGVRATLSPYLRADVGYRYNHRDLDDRVIDQFDSGFVDASIIWVPSPNFSAKADVERTIGEGSAPFSRLADITTYGLGLGWKPGPRTTLTARGEIKVIDEVGDVLVYQERRLAMEAAYDVSRHFQAYVGGLVERVEEDKFDIEYDRYRIGAGLRYKLNGYDDGQSAQTGSTKDGFVEALFARWPETGKLTIGVGYSHLNLPGTAMTIVTDPFVETVTGRVVDHDGNMDGYRIDLALDEIAQHQFSDGTALWFGAKGFYSRYESTQKSACDFSFTTDCLFANLKDFDPYDYNNTGPFGRLRTTTEKTVDLWGLAIEARLGTGGFEGSLKDSIPVTIPSPFRLGAAVRGLYQNTKLHSIDISVPDPIDYHEELDTNYYGGYIGFDQIAPLGEGFSLSLNLEAGLYYARTNYDASYQAFIPIGGVVFVTEAGRLDLNDDRGAAILSAKVELAKDVGWGEIGIYAEGDYYSYVPTVKLNDTDLAGGAPFDLVGIQADTELGSDNAYSYTLGARIKIPLNH